MAYVYRHIRLDKNQPFYIGIGSDDKYRRAYNFVERNKFWKAVADKTEYEVEILMDDLTWEQACKKEKEFISLYGRRDKKQGTLVNLTDGGEGSKGMIVSEKNKKKASERMKGKKYAKGLIVSEENKKKASKRMKGNRIALGYKHSEETKKDISQKMKGKKCALGCKRSEETKRKISETMKVVYWERLYDLEYENAKRLGFAD